MNQNIRFSRIILLAGALLFSSCAGPLSDTQQSMLSSLGEALGILPAQSAFAGAINNPGTLPGDITVEQPVQQNGSGFVPIRGVIALDSVEIGEKTAIEADLSVIGDGVHGTREAGEDHHSNEDSEGGRHEANRQTASHDENRHSDHDEHREHAEPRVVLEESARVESDFTVRAPSIVLEENAAILGTAQYNAIKFEEGASAANRITPMGPVPLLPPFLKGSPGSQSIEFSEAPLAPGNYDRLHLRRDRALELTGGFYHFRKVRLENGSSVICNSVCVILVQETFKGENRASLTPLSGTSNDLIVYVEHDVSFGAEARVTADLYSLNGIIRVGRLSRVEGNLAGQKIKIEERCRIKSGVAVPPVAVKLIRAASGGILEIPGKARLDVPAGALARDTLITITPADLPAGQDPKIQGFPALQLGTTRYEMKPDGLQFNSPATLTLGYVESEFDFSTQGEEMLRIYSSQTGGPWNDEGGTVDVQANTVTTQISHFTLFTVGSFDLAFHAVHVNVVGTIAYVSNWVDGLKIVDVSSPMTPVLLSTVPAPTTPYRGVVGETEIKGNYAYVTTDEAGLMIVDISNPRAPVVVTTYRTAATTWVLTVKIVGNYALIGCWGKFQVLDISNPTAPSLVYSADIPDMNLYMKVFGNKVYFQNPGQFAGWSIFEFDLTTLPIPQSTRSFGQYGHLDQLGYALDHNNDRLFTATKTDGFEIIDFTKSPMLQGTLPLTSDTFDMAVVGDRAFLAQRDGMRVIDISNPTAPTLLEFFPTPAAVGHIQIVGDLAYLAAASSGLRIINISSVLPPPGPQLTPVSGIATASRTLDTVVRNGIAYIADWQGGVRTLDVSDPTSPSLLGFVDTPGQATHIKLHGNYAFVADVGSGLQVLDISNPSTPYIVATVHGIVPISLEIVGNYAFVGGGFQFHTIDISNPRAPVLVATLYGVDQFQEMAVSGTSIFAVGDYLQERKLSVIDVSNPLAPAVISRVDSSSMGLSVSGSYAYTAGGSLLVFNISNPLMPVVVSPLYDAAIPFTSDVVVVGHRAFVARGFTGGVAAVDISRPAVPTILDEVNIGCFAVSLSVDSGYLYASCEKDGLRILRIN